MINFDNDPLPGRTTLLNTSAETPRVFHENTRWRLLSGCFWILLMLAVWAGVVAYPTVRFGLVAGELQGLIKPAVAVALPIALIGAPMVMIVAAGGLDLSVGSVVSVVAVVTAASLAKGASEQTAIATGLAVAAGIGTVNAFLVAVGAHGALVTLAVMTLLGNFAFLYTGQAGAIPIADNVLKDLSATPYLLYGTIAFLLFSMFLVQCTRFGRRFPSEEPYQSSTQNAFFRGLPYVLSSVTAGVVGILMLSARRAGIPSIGMNLELKVILAVVLGGACVGAGFGNVTGMVVGALVLAVSQIRMKQMDVPGLHAAVITSAALLVATFLAHLYYKLIARMYAARHPARPV
ncbi:MAG TPA: hypothetical protein ENN81_01495 [Phycisphaerales bacterium]|nr:hypothetical protein [Phycisphaerales bacterium]